MEGSVNHLGRIALPRRRASTAKLAWIEMRRVTSSLVIFFPNSIPSSILASCSRVVGVVTGPREASSEEGVGAGPRSSSAWKRPP